MVPKRHTREEGNEEIGGTAYKIGELKHEGNVKNKSCLLYTSIYHSITHLIFKKPTRFQILTMQFM